MKLQDAAELMVEPRAGDALLGDVARGRAVTLEVRVTGGRGTELQLMRDGTA